MCEIKKHYKRDKKELSGSLQKQEEVHVVCGCKMKSDVELVDTSGELLTLHQTVTSASYLGFPAIPVTYPSNDCARIIDFD